jgi:protein TonB
VAIHALLLGSNATWFKHLPQPTPYPDLITISLVALQPKGDKKASTIDKPADQSEKEVRPIEKKEALPSQKVVKQVPEKPLNPKRALKPIIPPVEKVPQQITTKKKTPRKKKIPPKKVKPKKSLKKITKKQTNKAPQEEVARVKPLEMPKPISEASRPENKSAPTPEESPFTASGSSSPIDPRNTAGKESTSEIAPNKGSAPLVTKGDTSAAGMIMAKPLYRKNSPPKYPRHARRKGYEGNVIIEVLVDEKGNVSDLKIFKSSGYEILDRSALSAVEKWLFKPGTSNGKAMKMWVRVPIRFKLN